MTRKADQSQGVSAAILQQGQYIITREVGAISNPPQLNTAPTSSPMTVTIKTTTGGAARIPQTAALYASAFRSDPAITYFLHALPLPQRHAYLEEYFTRLATAAALNNALFTEASDYASVAIILPPGKTVDNPQTLIPAGLFRVLWKLGFVGCWRMLGEYEPKTGAARRRTLGSFAKKFYYLFFVATREDARGRGLAGQLIGELQEKAEREQVPVWLEATTEYSAGVYEKLGFETVETVVLGKGVADADGNGAVGGDGVRIYCMVCWPSGGNPDDELRSRMFVC
jgi:ribosomal protein S18 acetylase RimI-like enzyme